MNTSILAKSMNSVGAKEKIIAKAWDDSKFKRLLVEKPRETLFKEFGFVFPAGINVRVVEETPSETYFVIPSQPRDRVSDDVSDKELDTVASMAPSNTNVMSGCRCCSSPCTPAPRKPKRKPRK